MATKVMVLNNNDQIETYTDTNLPDSLKKSPRIVYQDKQKATLLNTDEWELIYEKGKMLLDNSGNKRLCPIDSDILRIVNKYRSWTEFDLDEARRTINDLIHDLNLERNKIKMLVLALKTINNMDLNKRFVKDSIPTYIKLIIDAVHAI